MADLDRLWDLYQTDARIEELKHKAQHLGPSKDLVTKLKAADADQQTWDTKIKAADADRVDATLKVQSLKDKDARIERDLYSGTASAREVDTYNREREALARQIENEVTRAENAGAIVRSLEAERDAALPGFQSLKRQYASARKQALAEREGMDIEFKRLVSERPEKAKRVPPGLLARYEALRAKKGSGMARIVKGNCGGCGTNLPERLKLAVRDNQVVTCETCHRILYVSDSIL